MASEFTANILQRVAQAEAAVQAARADGDEHRADLHEADLANLKRLAGEHGVDLSRES
ncbi:MULTISPECIES: hypothetical protein [unclassified Crossiella]|uniref:hypothetical protein n=1 Tax=unclassified Crossiella TaxID=2620835 RepID=UPI0020003D28|nr:MULTISPECIES: hypothetical protein [unclassified Crossiella]MCK2244712.1 hypothetical protein [Crossiella sp. S99.2]MCK2258290.1 hypothetical protein [Crossiella sp. S99.1]